MIIKTVNMIRVSDWDRVVVETYARPYTFQQQDGCKPRGTFEFSVPSEEVYDYENDTVPEVINHEDMGVSFAAWLARDPKLNNIKSSDGSPAQSWGLDMWWERNFYPDAQMIANDLHARGLLAAGDYVIDIDW